MRFTPPRRARRRMAGFVMPWMLSRSTCGQREGRVSRQRGRGRGKRARRGFARRRTGGARALRWRFAPPLPRPLPPLPRPDMVLRGGVRVMEAEER